jgi:hypothetical protein
MASLVDLLLSRKLVPDGPTQVTVTVRPRRVAYLIDPVDPRFAFAAISSAMYTFLAHQGDSQMSNGWKYFTSTTLTK